MSDLILGFIGVFIGAMVLIVIYAAIYYYRHIYFKKEIVEIRKMQTDQEQKPDRLLSTMRMGFDALKKKDMSETSGMTYEERVKHPSWEGKPFAVKMNYWNGEVDRRKRSGNYKNIYPSM